MTYTPTIKTTELALERILALDWSNDAALDNPMQTMWWVRTSDDDLSCIYKQGLRSTVMSRDESRD